MTYLGSGTGRKPAPRLGTCREAKLVQEELKIFQSAWTYKKNPGEYRRQVIKSFNLS